MRRMTIPLMYGDAELRVLPGDDHNPPLPIHVTEYVDLDREHDFSPQLIRVTLPPGRQWALLPAEMFSREVRDTLADKNT